MEIWTIKIKAAELTLEATGDSGSYKSGYQLIRPNPMMVIVELEGCPLNTRILNSSVREIIDTNKVITESSNATRKKLRINVPFRRG